MSDQPFSPFAPLGVDAEFIWITECERTLDDVVVKLGAAGVDVAPEERIVVARWLDLFSDNCRLPLRYRLMVLLGMLDAAREKPVFDG